MENKDLKISELTPIDSGDNINEEFITPVAKIGGTPANFGVKLKAIKEWLYDLFKIEEKADKHPYLSLERVRSYYYRITFDKLPEENDLDIVPQGGCTAYVKDGALYRNLDWDYSETAEFEIHTKQFTGMSFVGGLNDQNLDDELIAQLPYRIVDGVNDYGIKISTNILFNDWGWHGTGDIPITRIPYWILTHIKSMDTIEEDLADLLPNLATTPGIDALGYLVQFLVTDGETTYVIVPPETADGQYTAINATANPKLSNFRWVPDATVDRADLQDRPTGVERWNLAPGASLEELRFTKAYEAPTRLSEFIGLRGTTKDSTDAELEAIYNEAHQLYLERQRNGQTWQTMHSIVYLQNGIKSLWVQEDYNVDYGYKVNDTYTFDDFLEALGTAMSGTWAKHYNPTTKKYEFTFTPNEE